MMEHIVAQMADRAMAEQLAKSREQGRHEQAIAMAGAKTLRDEFAMAALTGLTIDWKNGDQPDHFSELAYKIADAMLKAREQK